MELLDGSDPETVGGYPLLARLGEGGMGRVYLSRTVSGRPLALKTVRSEFGREPGFEERFAREIRNSDRVRSPWTPAVVDYSPPGQRPPWLATEYVPAPSLAEWVRRYGPLPEQCLVALAAELFGALGAVHGAGLAHRDVKPSNVLLGRRSPLLIDFGIARAREDTRHTRTGGVIGSPGYLAPEQVSAGESGAPGDVFSLAAVLVYAATGRGPFSNPKDEFSPAVLLYRIVHQEPNLDGVPAALVPLLRSCLAKDPEQRATLDTVSVLLERMGGRCGTWPQLLPEGLEKDLAVREEEAHALISATVQPPSVAAVSREPEEGPASADVQTAVLPRVDAVRRWVSGRTGRAVAGTMAVALTAAAGTFLVWHFSDDASAGTPSPSSTATSLPEAWAGTWVGTGPGNPTSDGFNEPRTNRFSVALTLHPAQRGEPAGKQVSRVTEVNTKRELGCTETLRLQEIRKDSLVLKATTSHATEQGAEVACPSGSTYVVTMTGRDTLSLSDKRDQSAGAPSTLTRR
ncbi:Serine/threonine protein kinase [Streptomyces sp. Ag82_O1-12]|uniref:serine/threonine-protein kinase n=1 Tax=unclassified Streptomyces TaxID=2593676 RepID=UPI000BCA099D|nr:MULTISPECIES: serine/threonine-protein kinase [unclassified Streptomyces]SMQ14331.1 Serine/threonine protein kinase [Streptomyces sp. Ag82_O1-12]SOD43357.1 Serine/threonine protein kinase [Streptomyces sp. Ag82_G6-1]